MPAGQPSPGSSQTKWRFSVSVLRSPSFQAPPVLRLTREWGDCPGQGPILWHLDTYATRAVAETAKGPRGTVVESLGKIWPFTIAETGWRPSGGERVAKIGPLPVKPDRDSMAVYLGKHLRSRNDGTSSHTFGSGSLLHTDRRDMSGRSPTVCSAGAATATWSSCPPVLQCC